MWTRPRAEVAVVVLHRLSPRSQAGFDRSLCTPARCQSAAFGVVVCVIRSRLRLREGRAASRDLGISAEPQRLWGSACKPEIGRPLPSRYRRFDRTTPTEPVQGSNQEQARPGNRSGRVFTEYPPAVGISVLSDPVRDHPVLGSASGHGSDNVPLLLRSCPVLEYIIRAYEQRFRVYWWRRVREAPGRYVPGVRGVSRRA